MSPRASGCHQGEPSPVSAGTNDTPPVESTLHAIASLSAALASTPSPSRSHCKAAPRDEDRTFERVAVGGGRREQAVRRRRHLVARVDEHEAPGAVRHLGLAPRMAALPEERRLLVAGDRRGSAASGRAAQPRRTRASEREDRRQHARDRRRGARAGRRPSRACRGRHSIVRDAFVVSVACTAPCVSCQTSHESTVPKASPGRRVLSEQPLELRPREVRIGHEPGALADQVRVERPAALGRAPVLPHDRGRDRTAGGAVPEDRRLALVRDRDGLDAVEPCLGCGGEHALPDLVRVVLDPTRLRKVLAAARRSHGRWTRSSSSTTRHVVPVVPWSIARITRAS